MGTKSNPGKFDCYSAAKPDEPMFVLLARDPIAPILVELWATIRQQVWWPEHEHESQLDKIAEAQHVANEMRVWKRKAKK